MRTIADLENRIRDLEEEIKNLEAKLEESSSSSSSSSKSEKSDYKDKWKDLKEELKQLRLELSAKTSLYDEEMLVMKRHRDDFKERLYQSQIELKRLQEAGVEVQMQVQVE